MAGRSERDRRVARRNLEIGRGVGREVRTIREDVAIPRAALARAAGIHPITIARLESGRRLPRISILSSIADALGADLTIRIVPGAGIAIRDRAQAWMVESFLRSLNAAWRPTLEVPVSTPARGVIDLVLRHADSDEVVAVELQSALRRVEQTLRWSAEKSAGLAGLPIGRCIDGSPATIHRMLVLRSDPATRAVVRSLATTFAAAYPVDASKAVASIRDGSRLEGSAIVWMEVRGRYTHLLDGAPRELRATSAAVTHGAL